METGIDSQQSGRLRTLAFLLVFTVLLRLPFLNQAIQGDDVYYLLGAQHALIDPAHPSHARYIFQGELVDMRGHPHPPLNSWMLAGLLLLWGDVYEAPFHAAYIVFSLIAVAAMWSLARRWSPEPVLATVLFIATPAFLVNGTSLEADLPFLAFWLAGLALFTSGRLIAAAVALALAAMTAYQAIVATPILLVYCWLHQRRSKVEWAVSLTPVVTVGCYQLYERLTSGALPATVLAGYFSAYGLQQLANKLRNAAALTAHTGWLVFPAVAFAAFRDRWAVAAAAAGAGMFIDPHPLFWASFAVGVAVISGCIRRRPDFLQCWVLLFFAAALALFFAGSARYLLPMAAPVALLISRTARPAWLRTAAVLNLALGLCLAVVNYQHWNQYRRFVRAMPEAFRSQHARVWANGEWGLRFYLESNGALPLARAQALAAGDQVVTSALGLSIPITAPLSQISEREIRPALPFRLIGLGSKSGYSSAALGLRPFDFSTQPVDRVRAQIVLPRKATRQWLPMNAPEAEQQIVSGVYQLEGDTRWMGTRAVILLAAADSPRPLHVDLFFPPSAPARHVRILVDGAEVHTQTLPGPGMHSLVTRPVAGTAVTIELDKTFSVPGDFRQLGAVLTGVGFR